MTALVHNHMTWHHCCGRSTCGAGGAVGLRTNGPGRRLGGRVGRRTAALKARGKRRYPGLVWSFVAVTDPTWCGHVWPGGGGQR
mgnify:CR=1 FL=1